MALAMRLATTAGYPDPADGLYHLAGSYRRLEGGHRWLSMCPGHPAIIAAGLPAV
jgi:hypothetical protein